MKWQEFDNPEEEKVWLEKIVKDNPNDAKAHYELATVYENIDDNDKAIEYCEKATALDPDNELYLAFLIFLIGYLDKQRRFNALTRFIELRPDEGEYYTERVIDELGIGDDKFTFKYIENFRAQGKERVANTLIRWIWNP